MKHALGAQSTYRERVLWEIAERYHDYVDTLNGPTGVPGDGSGTDGMPKTYTATVREFERLLCLMRNQAKQQSFNGHSLGTLRWHIVEYHLKAQRVVRQQPILARKNGKMVALRTIDGKPATRPVLAYIRDPQVREQKARDGIAWMAQHWGLATEPMLPDTGEAKAEPLLIAA